MGRWAGGYLVYEAELHELVRQRGGGVAARHGARQLAVHLVVHAQQDRHLEGAVHYLFGTV